MPITPAEIAAQVAASLPGCRHDPLPGLIRVNGAFGELGRAYEFALQGEEMRASLTLELADEFPPLLLEGPRGLGLFPHLDRHRLLEGVTFVVSGADLDHGRAYIAALPEAILEAAQRLFRRHAVAGAGIMISELRFFFPHPRPQADWGQLVVDCLSYGDRFAAALEDLPTVIPRSLVRCDHCTHRFEPNSSLKCPRCAAPVGTPSPGGPAASARAVGPVPSAPSSCQAALHALRATLPEAFHLHAGTRFATTHGLSPGTDRSYVLRAILAEGTLNLAVRLETKPGELPPEVTAQLAALADRHQLAGAEVDATYLWLTFAGDIRTHDFAPPLAAVLADATRLAEVIDTLPGAVVSTATKCLFCGSLYTPANDRARCPNCGAEQG